MPQHLPWPDANVTVSSDSTPEEVEALALRLQREFPNDQNVQEPLRMALRQQPAHRMQTLRHAVKIVLNRLLSSAHPA
jgi:hypothetical protein